VPAHAQVQLKSQPLNERLTTLEIVGDELRHFLACQYDWPSSVNRSSPDATLLADSSPESPRRCNSSAGRDLRDRAKPL
jgi:hypothetical protein